MKYPSTLSWCLYNFLWRKIPDSWSQVCGACEVDSEVGAVLESRADAQAIELDS